MENNFFQDVQRNYRMLWPCCLLLILYEIGYILRILIWVLWNVWAFSTVGYLTLLLLMNVTLRHHYSYFVVFVVPLRLKLSAGFWSRSIFDLSTKMRWSYFMCNSCLEPPASCVHKSLLISSTHHQIFNSWQLVQILKAFYIFPEESIVWYHFRADIELP